ncbi:MAG TPA: tyrosine-protein phosphatase [Acidimicrobiales bacterium]
MSTATISREFPPNFRDAARGALRRGVLFRSASPHLATPDELVAFVDARITTWVDLCSVPERDVFGDGGLPGLGIKRICAPIIDDIRCRVARFDGRVPVDQGPLYLELIDQQATLVAAAVRAIAAADEACLVTCAGGRDRTGIVVAVALAAAGADHDDIVDDYVATDLEIERIINRLSCGPVPDFMPLNSLQRSIPPCDPDTMRAVLS